MNKIRYASILKPFMNDAEILVVDHLLEHLKPKKALEWGCGHSTLYFSRFCETWDSIEHNAEWFEKIGPQTPPGVRVHLVNWDNYVLYPAQLGHFDFILIDGRLRRRCLLHAYELVGPDGTIVLHDAERTYYHCAMRTGIFLSERLWLYSQK